MAGRDLLAAFRAAVANLADHSDEIDALNVYPVPDGDTGQNMLATIRAALEEAERAPDQRLASVAAAASFGALMGARGNSGVILSQVLRGMAEAQGTGLPAGGGDLARALAAGSEAAYAAVVRPVEGTMLTVIREAAAGAVRAADRGGDVEAVLAEAVRAAEDAVSRTTSMLAVLRESGVTDAGGAGIHRLLEGALFGLLDTPLAIGTQPRPAPRERRPQTRAQPEHGYGYETVYVLVGHAPLDLVAIRNHLESIGESVLVAGDSRMVKVHVHNEQPDAVIAYGLSLGTLSRIGVENLDQQANDLREAAAAAFVVPGPEPGMTDRPDGSSRADAAIGVVAVVAGEGIEAIFIELGAATTVRGDRSIALGTAELLDAVEAAGAREVILLPNDPDLTPVAHRVAGMSSRRVHVVPTRTAPEGIAALMALDPGVDGSANIAPMTRAAAAVQTLSVADVRRDAVYGKRRVGRGQVVVLGPDGGLVAVHGARDRAIELGLAALRPGFELLTIYWGRDADAHEAAALGERIRARLPAFEVELVRGDQPRHRYLLAAE